MNFRKKIYVKVKPRNSPPNSICLYFIGHCCPSVLMPCFLGHYVPLCTALSANGPMKYKHIEFGGRKFKRNFTLKKFSLRNHLIPYRLWSAISVQAK
jgi:hypothetical protein